MKNSLAEKKLRSGFTTGACAAAAAVAAWRVWQGASAPASVDLVFPDGKRRAIGVAGARRFQEQAEAWIVKDAGDDVDVTDRAIIRVFFGPAVSSDSRDYIERCGGSELALRGAGGVGWVTRPGLDAPEGKWAINPTPRRMIVENLAAAGFGGAFVRMLLEIGIDGGEQLALRTLNPVLGVEGGLSILGTSGIVIPCSNAAYAATIRVLIRGAADAGGMAALVTGGRTHAMARRHFPDIPESAIIRIGDFFKESAVCAAEFALRRATLCCMPGKLLKYARGLACTHAHVAPQSMAALETILDEEGAAQAIRSLVPGCRGFREFLEQLEPDMRLAILRMLGNRAMACFQAWNSSTALELMVFEPNGRLCLRLPPVLPYAAVFSDKK